MLADRRILGIVMARQGSKGVPGKHLVEINNKKVIEYTYEHAEASNLLDYIAVSTDDNRIIELTKIKYSEIITVKRPKKLAKDDMPLTPAIIHCLNYVENLKKIKFDILIILHGNVPIRKKNIIDDVIRYMITNNYESVRTVYEDHLVHPYYALVKNSDGKAVRFIKGEKIPAQRQELNKCFFCDASVIGVNRNKIVDICKQNIYEPEFWGKTFYPYVESKYDTYEIDNWEDLQMVEFLITNGYLK